MIGLFSPNWKEAIVSTDCTLFDILTSLSHSGLLIACFVDAEGKLEAILTDNDIRKALISGKKLEDKAYPLANKHPKVGDYRASSEWLKNFAMMSKIQDLPLVDEYGILKDIFIVSIRETRVENFPAKKSKPLLANSMFIVAGGLGSRLSSVLGDRPKPLAPVGSQPILATILAQGVLAGIRNFYISVNYRADQIKAFLEKPEYKSLNITVIHEPYRTGTGGSLSLIPELLKEPLLVCNADILTTVSFDRIIAHHTQEQAMMTCAIRPHFVPIPFGVFKVEGGLIKDIKEKPEETFLVNAAIYVLNPQLIELVPKNTYFDMPDLIKIALEKRLKVLPFYLHEYWIDIGKPDDYQRANLEFENYFG